MYVFMHTYHNHHHATSGTMTCGKQICSSPQCFTTIQISHKWETHHLFIFQRALPGISPNRFPHSEKNYDCDGISLQGVAHTVPAVTDPSCNSYRPKWIPTESSSGILHITVAPLWSILPDITFAHSQSPTRDEEEIYRGLEDLVTEDQYTDFYQKHLGGGNFGQRYQSSNY